MVCSTTILPGYHLALTPGPDNPQRFLPFIASPLDRLGEPYRLTNSGNLEIRQSKRSHTLPHTMPSLIKPSPPNLVSSIPYPDTPSDLTLTTLSCGTVVADTTTLTEFIFRILQLSRYSARNKPPSCVWNSDQATMGSQLHAIRGEMVDIGRIRTKVDSLSNESLSYSRLTNALERSSKPFTRLRSFRSTSQAAISCHVTATNRRNQAVSLKDKSIDIVQIIIS
jgi:hypothetical protein